MSIAWLYKPFCFVVNGIEITERLLIKYFLDYYSEMCGKKINRFRSLEEIQYKYKTLKKKSKKKAEIRDVVKVDSDPLTSLSIVVEKYIEIYGHNIIFYISCLLYLFLIISRPHSEHLLFFCKIAPVYSIQIDLNSSAHKSSAACKSYNRTMIKKDLSYCA